MEGSGTKQGCLLWPLPFSRGSTQYDETKRKESYISKGRKDIVFICRWHHSLYKRPEIIHKNLLELINELRTLARYKAIYKKKRIIILCKSDGQIGIEILKYHLK